MRLEGKTAIVTGAGSGFGAGIARKFATEGARVMVADLNIDAAHEIANKIKGIACHVDVADGASVEAMTHTALDQMGQIDLLVNNAGTGGIGPFEDASADRLRKIMEVNFFAPVELTRSLLSSLHASPDAVICNVGSVLGHRAVADKSEYCASKFAMHGWSDSLRAELSGSSIQVTLVSPSTTRSEFFDELIDTESPSQSKRIGSWPPERVAAATLKSIRHRRAEVILSA